MGLKIACKVNPTSAIWFLVCFAVPRSVIIVQNDPAILSKSFVWTIYMDTTVKLFNFPREATRTTRNAGFAACFLRAHPRMRIVAFQSRGLPENGGGNTVSYFHLLFYVFACTFQLNGVCFLKYSAVKCLLIHPGYFTSAVRHVFYIYFLLVKTILQWVG